MRLFYTQPALRARNAQIYEAYESAKMTGGTLDSVGRQFGLSRERVRQIHIQELRQRTTPSAPISPQTPLTSMERFLRLRLCNVLLNAGYTTLSDIAKAKDVELLTIPGVGRHSLKILRDFCKQYDVSS